MSAYYEAHREERLVYQRRYRLDHPEEHRAYQRLWMKAYRAANEEYRRRNRERMRIKRARAS
jgi:hypothetical protein